MKFEKTKKICIGKECDNLVEIPILKKKPGFVYWCDNCKWSHIVNNLNYFCDTCGSPFKTKEEAISHKQKKHTTV